jgi:hypothetical protein
MRYVLADARKGVEESFHLVEHAIDDHRKFGERIVGLPVREAFPQVAGDDALYPRINFNDTFTSTSAHRQTDREAKKHSQDQGKRKRPTKDLCDFPDFGDISPNHQQIAIRQTMRDHAGCLFLPATFVRSVDNKALYGTIDFKIGRQTLQVTRDSAAV